MSRVAKNPVSLPQGVTATVAAPPKREDNVLYIMDSNPGQRVATQNYNLQVRR